MYLHDKICYNITNFADKKYYTLELAQKYDIYEEVSKSMYII
jgi:hypothetical protein